MFRQNHVNVVITLMVIVNAINMGGQRNSWDYYGWRKISLSTSSYTQIDWNQTLITKINQVSNQIHQETLRGGCNLISIHPKMLLLLQTLQFFSGEEGQLKLARYKIAIDKDIPFGKILVSHHDPMFETLRLSNMVLSIEEEVVNEVPEPIDGFDYSWAIEPRVLTMKFLLINSDEHVKALANPNIRVVSEDMLTQEITVLNYRVNDEQR